MLKEYTLWGERDKVKTAIARLQEFEPVEGYYLAFSGGKDSVVIKELAILAGVKFDAHYNLTTVDPPEVVNFIKKEHSDVKIDKPSKTMWQLIEKEGTPPTRLMRYCCRFLKERGGIDRLVVTGVRAQESRRRANRQVIDRCYSQKKTWLQPIIDWSEIDVWEFIKSNNLPHCSLYNIGYRRLGCIMCPMKNTKGMLYDAKRYPKYYENYLRAFDRMLKRRKELGKETTWNSAQEVMDWWIYNPPKAANNDQQAYFVQRI